MEEIRQIVRCPEKSCQLNQFVTKNGLCRRCKRELFPKIQEDVPSDVLLAEKQQEIKSISSKRIHIGYALKLIRLCLGLSQGDVAKVMDIPRTYITKMENEALEPTIKQFVKFCTLLELDVAGVLEIAQAKGWSNPSLN